MTSTHGTAVPVARGPRVALRELRHEDGEEFTARTRESRELHHPWLFPPDSVKDFARYAGLRVGNPANASLLVCDQDADGAIAGFVNINNIVRGAFLNGTLGYGAFAHAAGRGLMSEALSLVTAYAFGPLGLHRLEANIQPGNAASLALVRRAGFRKEGFSPAMLHVNGEWRDHERWALTAEMPTARAAMAEPHTGA
ncbi:GNAT family N-acetyltransferase [Streptomyces lichenis]|uniref:GNAT family N-acetyltransferase n=1 Tax=Streptomyces lichenis TaxID=2306967 RepID=A0ABT0IDX0_9ACTN|nr:GNAT family protein [Streptomyces lichenis]MCK8679535.1 GNAT family N-acetyltransferase [Streptomyces lichenis]